MKIGETLYLDHQASTPLDHRVLSKMAPYQSESFGNPHSSDHSLGWDAARAIEKAAASVGRLIGGDTDEITFTSGATESNNMALLGLGRRALRGKRKRILVSAVEHKCVLASAGALEDQHGFIVEQIPVDRQGHVDLLTLDKMLNDDVLAISVMAVNNEIGTIQDIRQVSSYARRYGVVFHCDAAQAPIALPIGWLASQADIVSLSGHKMYGPKGVGAIFIAREVQDRIEPLIYGGGQQQGLRSGTVPVPLCVGMGAAAALLIGDDAEDERRELRRRRDTFVYRMKKIRWQTCLNGPEGTGRHPGNANIRFPEFSAHEILGALQPRLAAATGSACTSGIPEPSHVLMATGLARDEAESSIRFSLGFGTSDGDVDEAVTVVCETLDRLSNAGLTRSA